MKQSAAAHLKEACMKREIKRAKRTKILPQTFQTIDIHNGMDKNTSVSNGDMVMRGDGIIVDIRTPYLGVFAGQITMQDTPHAMRQATSEHTQHRALRTEPGRRSYHVDAAVSRENGLTGLAVVSKIDRQDWASPWTAKGYRIEEALCQVDAEACAIWQAMQLVLEKVRDDRANLEQVLGKAGVGRANLGQDPCSIAVIYSDCLTALERVVAVKLGSEKVVKKIIDSSIALQ